MIRPIWKSNEIYRVGEKRRSQTNDWYVSFVFFCYFVLFVKIKSWYECLGGSRVGQKGYFVQPTVFADVKDDMTIAKDVSLSFFLLSLFFFLLSLFFSRSFTTITRDHIFKFLCENKRTIVVLYCRRSSVQWWVSCHSKISMKSSKEPMQQLMDWVLFFLVWSFKKTTIVDLPDEWRCGCIHKGHLPSPLFSK